MLLSTNQPSIDSKQKELPLNDSFTLDVAVVLGEGPNLSVLLPDEATLDQHEVWKQFIQDPLHRDLPDFYLLTGHAYTKQIQDITEDETLSELERSRAIESKRQEWQHNGEFALRRIGKLNALAAGDALYTGKVGKLILSGGRTMTAWQREKIVTQFTTLYPDKKELGDKEFDQALHKYIRNILKWPSEAELMQDIIVTAYGWNFFSRAHSQESLHQLYTERFGEDVNDSSREDYKAFEKRVYEQYLHETLKPRLLLEEESMNTLDNVVCSMNTYPELLSDKHVKIGLFASDWQRTRALLLAERFLIHVEEDGGISSQQYLRKRALERKKVHEMHVMNTLMDTANAPIAALQAHNESLLHGLTDEAYANYWSGWIFKMQDPQMFIDVLHQYNNPQWVESMTAEFRKVGLDFTKLQEVDLLRLAEEEPIAYQQIIDKGLALTRPDLRNTLPTLKEMQKAS